jgi:hypothetical protein
MNARMLLFITGFAMAAGLAGQTVQELRGELSAPFGSVPGRIILAGDRMIFLDDERPAASFYADLGNVDTMSSSQGVTTIQLKKPVRDRDGERSRLSFKLSDPAGEAALAAWQKSPGRNGTSAAGTAAGTAPAVGVATYTAKLDKRFGSSNGKLLVDSERVRYESLDDIKDSREWMLGDIKEIKQKNPYELELEPFKGGKYTFQLAGQGMSTEEFTKLADRIAQVRGKRQ